MTREEAIEVLQNPHEFYCDKDGNVGYIFNPNTQNGKAFDMAIKALEHPEKNVIAVVPCGDSISRQAALDAFGLSEKTRKYGGDHSGYDTILLYEVQDALEALPPVTPQQKTGHWKHNKCDVCGASRPPLFDNYCSNCGAKMQEVEE